MNTLQRRNDLKTILLVQIVTVPVVLAFFKFISPIKVAALFAGALFILFGLFGFYKTRAHASLPTNFLAMLFSIHIFLISIPMIVVRLLNWDAEFNTLTIWWLPAPLFHGLSSGLYLFIFSAAAFQYWRLGKARSS